MKSKREIGLDWAVLMDAPPVDESDYVTDQLTQATLRIAVHTTVLSRQFRKMQYGIGGNYQPTRHKLYFAGELAGALA